MIGELFDFLSEALYQSFSLALLASFLWGVASILLSPCHLSSIPLVIGFIQSHSDVTTKKSLHLSSVFAVGILITIAIIGLITISLGRLMGDIGTIGNYAVALVFFAVGLYLLDVLDLSRFGLNIQSTKYRGWLAALVLGLLFGIGLGPCAFAFMAPVLGVVFEISQTQMWDAIALLAAFAIGHCIVIALFGAAAGVVQQYLNWSDKSRVVLYSKKICGVLVIAAGFYFIYTTL